MANRAKAKGTSFETAIVNLLRDNGWPYAKRRTLSGSEDEGDIALGDGIAVTVEAKAHKTYSLQQWLREAETERHNSDSEVGVVWFKFVGKAKAEDGAVLMTPQTLMQLLKLAGYHKGEN